MGWFSLVFAIVWIRCFASCIIECARVVSLKHCFSLGKELWGLPSGAFNDVMLSLQQFYFSKPFLQLFVRELTRLDYTHVLCVGTPRYCHGHPPC